jgi:hypothetical protein
VLVLFCLNPNKDPLTLLMKLLLYKLINPNDLPPTVFVFMLLLVEVDVEGFETVLVEVAVAEVPLTVVPDVADEVVELKKNEVSFNF